MIVLGSFEINFDLSDEYTCVSLYDSGTNFEACLFSNNTFIRHNIISDGTEDWRLFDLNKLDGTDTKGGFKVLSHDEH